MKRTSLPLLLPFAIISSSFGQNSLHPISEKPDFTLSAPEKLRDMSTDRPDKTESPYTVDAGHFQLEMDFVSYSHDRDKSNGGNTVTESFSLAPVNLKFGLSRNIDLQVVLETYNHVRVSDKLLGTVQKMSGFGDVTTRLKVNLWGNEGGKTAFGIMPFLKIPTSQDGLGNNAVEGGVILPLALELPGEWGMGLMTEFDFQQDGVGNGYHPTFVNSLTFSHGIYGKLGGYAEFFSEVSAENGSPWIGTVDFGLTYALTDDIQLDAGINIGVTTSADDFNPFIGLSWRF